MKKAAPVKRKKSVPAPPAAHGNPALRLDGTIDRRLIRFGARRFRPFRSAAWPARCARGTFCDEPALRARDFCATGLRCAFCVASRRLRQPASPRRPRSRCCVAREQGNVRLIHGARLALRERFPASRRTGQPGRARRLQWPKPSGICPLTRQGATRSCGREAEGGGLLNRYRFVKPYRGFEIPRSRQSH